jgi:hypothetical protein
MNKAEILRERETKVAMCLKGGEKGKVGVRLRLYERFIIGELVNKQ